MVIPCAICIIIIIAVTLGVYFSGKYYFSNDDYYYRVVVNSKEILFETDEKFLSVALDTSFMRCFFHKFTESDWERFEKLSKRLFPAYLRVGGTEADRTIFNIEPLINPEYFSSVSCDDFAPTGNLYISGEDWLKLNNFAQKSNLSLIFDLNVLLRKDTQWDNTNAKLLLRFSERKAIPLDFQLGNEPDSFPHVFNQYISGSQLAKDFRSLRKLLNTTKLYMKSKLIGPDVTKPKHLTAPSLKYLDEFLSTGDVVDAVSWHQYYLNGHNASLEDFFDLETFDILLPQTLSVLKTVRRYYLDKPVWISETGSAYGGGAPGLSDRFAASFLWVDKLGLAARSNISVVIRQSLFKGNYALIGKKLYPNPDYWISVLYKHLVGSRVLDVYVKENTESKSLRFYGHCANFNSLVKGNIVIFGINLSSRTELFVLSQVSITYPVYAFIFRPKNDDLRAQTVLLNDHELLPETGIEDMVNMAEKVKQPLQIPSYSIGFWVAQETTELACKR